MAQSCQTRRYAKGEMIFRAGPPCEAFHRVATGHVKLFQLSPGAGESG
jgi:CRP-like cAMP-binding protein